MTTVAVVDYGLGNLQSVAHAFETLQIDVVVTDRPSDLEKADRIVLPGVGAFAQGMQNLERRNLIGPLEEQVLKKKKPFLGICLGMQLLAQEGHEHGRHAGLGWVSGRVEPLAQNRSTVKSIHIGWNEAVPQRSSALFAGLGKTPNFYFVHGYHMVCAEDASVSAVSHYGRSFTSAIQRGNICGVQFHPEKSQEVGLDLLKNFLRWDPRTEKTAQETETGAVGKPSPKIRLIPTLLLKNGRLTKTVRFQTVSEGIRRDVGDPIKAPVVYDAQLPDELIYLDIRASLEGRGIDQLLETIGRISGQIFMPLTVGGGIQNVEQIRRLLQAGADKVAINSEAVSRPDVIGEAARIFGSQCVVVSIDARRRGSGYEVFTHSGTRAAGLEPAAWAKTAEQAGAGEILLTSIDRDGTMEGYDLELIRRVSDGVKIPVIASGGCGSLQDLVDAVEKAHASAVAAASIFHFRDHSPIKAKAFMKRASLPIRM